MLANDDVSISFQQGEVHCLLGENGAGKTTLMNIAFGLYRADSGEIRLRDRPVDITSSAVALQNGIGMVHQHFMLVDPLTVAENVVLGHEPPSFFKYQKDKANQDVRDLSARYGLAVDPTALIEDLPVGVRQRVEILKALYRSADILILDEPTAVLSPPEVQELYQTMKFLKESGKTIIFITHKLKETMAVADRVTVLRDGRVVATVNRADTNPHELAKMMVGRDVILRVNKLPREPGAEVLTVNDLTVNDHRGLPAVQGLSFCVHAGEILGLAGIEGNGQSELIEALTGLCRPSGGRVTLNEKDLTNASPAERLTAGLGHVPEDRLLRGLISDFTVEENVVLGYHRQARFQKRGLLQTGRIADYARKLVKAFDIRTAGITKRAGSLSGGNQQKVVLARVFSQEPIAMVVSQPTRGVDVGATEYIHQQMLEMREQGTAILLISADLDEIRSLSDQIGVLYQGRLVALKRAEAYTDQEIGLLMAGMGAAGGASTPGHPGEAAGPKDKAYESN